MTRPLESAQVAGGSAVRPLPPDPPPEIGSIEEVSIRFERLISETAIPAYVVRPQEPWRWQIAGYLYLGGLGAGAYAVWMILGWLGFGLEPAYVRPMGGWAWDWTMAAVLWAPLLTGVGALLLILDLGKNWIRFVTAGRNPRTSWMARGFGILLSFIVVAGVTAAVALFAPEWRASSVRLWQVAEAVAVAAALGTAAYTGILLRSMRYIPAWRAPHIPLLFLVSALSTGSMGIWLGVLVARTLGADAGSAESLAEAIEWLEMAVLLVEATVLGLYVRYLSAGNPEARQSARTLVEGAWRYGFWVGIVGCALVVPFLLHAVNAVVGSLALGAVAASCVLVGGLILRLAVLGVGIKECPPLYRLGEWRTRHAPAETGGRPGVVGTPVAGR